MSTDTALEPIVQTEDSRPVGIKPFLSDHKHIKEIIRRLENENKDRISQYARICDKFNGVPPFDPAELKNLGQEWRSNFPTHFMLTMIRYMLEPYANTTKELKYLTASRLDAAKIEEESMLEEKSQIFRECITWLLRSWDEFNTLTRSVPLERLLYGWVGAVYLDDVSWSPVLGRVDELLLPEDAPANEDFVPYFVFLDHMYPHQLVEYLYDPEISDDMGWNIKNLVKAINSAKPQDSTNTNEIDERKRVEELRKITSSDSFSSENSVIKLGHLFGREYTGRVSHWIIDYNSGDVLFEGINQFQNMKSCLTLFPLEIGIAGKFSGKVHGSRGAGRDLYNTHVTLDSNRNLIWDTMHVKGLIPLKQTQNAFNNDAAISIQHPVAVLDPAFEVQKVELNVSVSEFIQLDQFTTGMSQFTFGVYMPAQGLAEKDQPVKRQDYMADIEQRMRSDVVAQYFSQFFKFVGKIQKRVCSPENISKAMILLKKEEESKLETVTSDVYELLVTLAEANGEPPPVREVEDDIAIICILRMLRRKLNPEEIIKLAYSPAGLTLDDVSVMEAQAIEAVVQRYMGDPSVKQPDLKMMDIASKLGYRKASKLLIPEEDNTLVTESTRQQTEELFFMMQGLQIDVSPRDNHIISMNVIHQKAKEMGTALENITPDMLPIISNIIAHHDNHLNSAMAQGMQQDQLQQYIQFSQTMNGLLEQIGAQLKNQPAAVADATQGQPQAPQQAPVA